MVGRHISVNPDSLQDALSGAVPGDTLLLQPGQYSCRLAAAHIRGTKGQPVTLRGAPGAVVDGGRRFEDFRLEANREARRVQDEDKYPGLYEIADHAQWTFADCEWLIVENVIFQGCWPTCIYLSECRFLSFARLDMREGTFAFYAVGANTHDILIERCRWVQDISPRHNLWSVIGWKKVHEDEPVKDTDARAYDGDFFRAYAIQGGVTLRDNQIVDAFNGVHLFNDADHPSTSLNRDIWIYRNTFTRIRDNPIEPEVAAFNWWTFHNTFYNCHAWVSLELGMATHIYVFANTGWFDDMPGPIADDTFGGAVFKLDKKQKLTAKPGPHYAFNNSWYLRSAYIKNGAISNFHHFNNAAHYCSAPDHGSHGEVAVCSADRRMFWESGDVPDEKAFTRDWQTFGIEFRNDMIAHPDFPAMLMRVGYAIERGLGQLPGFVDPLNGMLQLRTGAAACGSGTNFAIHRPSPLPDWQLAAGLDLGAYQGEILLAPPNDFSERTSGDRPLDMVLADIRASGPLIHRRG
jgi:hypothetical protein